ncbi:MAG: hypothetical protein HY302_15815 [Opitutae bacterium]|nr:hypothetical protein [Opitutae bacterium]
MNGLPKAPDELIRDYRRRGVLVDANLLIVYLIGVFDVRQLVNCRATKSFSRDDFRRLESFISKFDRIITTPHVLTEVSNLAQRLPDCVAQNFMGYFGALLEHATLKEESTAANLIAASPAFPRFGLTDVAISFVAPGNYLVLTTDFALVGLLDSRGVDVVNFNHLRDFAPQQAP